MGRFLDILRLIRVPLVFTTMADLLVGMAWLQSRFGDLDLLGNPAVHLAFLASACLYAFGMATNDILDRERDRTIHPERPLPSGRISLAAAWGIAIALLLVAMAASVRLGSIPAAMAAGIALLILAYNGLAKSFPYPGSIVMGLIRGANVLFGASVLDGRSRDLWPVAMTPAVAITGYIALVTVVSTSEENGDRWRSTAALAAILAPLAIAAAPSLPAIPWLLLLLAGIVVWRVIAILRSPSRKTIALTVWVLLLGLFVLDAHLVLAAGRGLLAAAVIALVLPSLALSRLLRMAS